MSGLLLIGGMVLLSPLRFAVVRQASMKRQRKVVVQVKGSAYIWDDPGIQYLGLIQSFKILYPKQWDERHSLTSAADSFWTRQSVAPRH